MSESTIDSAQSKAQEQVINFEVGQKYTTSEGCEYVVDFIARESGNIEDLFAVYHDTESIQEGQTEKYYLKKTSEIKSADDFEVGAPSSSSNEDTQEGDESVDVSIGQTYQHFKTKDFYVIKAIANDPENPKIKFVIYEGQYDSPDFGHNPIWVREYEDFTGMKVFGENELDKDGQKREPVKRFELIK